MSEKLSGGCLCGKVRYEVSGPFEAFFLCHCSQCQRSTGSAHASNLFTSEDRLEWKSGAELVKRFTPEVADMISKAFCSHCGSLVPYTSLKSGKLIVPAGSLDDDPGMSPGFQIFWRDRAPWYDGTATAKRCEQWPEK